METREIEELLPPRTPSLRFSVESLDQMLRRLFKWRSQRGVRFWSFIIFNCCDRTRKGQHWLLLILPPSPASSVVLFDSLGQTYPSLMNVFRQLKIGNIWRNNRRVQSWSSDSCGAHCVYFIYCFLNRFDNRYSLSRVAGNVMSRDYRFRSTVKCDSLVREFVKNLLEK